MNPLIGFIGNNMMSEYHAERDYDRELNMMAVQNRLNASNATNAPMQQVQGMRMAGLNPALSQSLGSAPVQAVSKGSAGKAETIPMSMSDMLLGAQKDNVEANTAKLEEEKRGIEQQNDITDAANSAAANTYVANCDREIRELQSQLDSGKLSDSDTDAVKNRIAELEESKKNVSDPNFVGALGIAQGLKSGAEAAKANMDTVKNFYEGKLDIDVVRKKLGNGTADILARMPRETWRELTKRIENIKQLTAESKSKQGLIGAQAGKLTAEIEQIGNAIVQARLNDENFLRQMAKYAPTEEERKLWANGLKNLKDTEMRKLIYDVGGGIVKGVATGGAVGGVSSLANSILTGKGVKSDLKFDEDLKKHDQNKAKSNTGSNPPNIKGSKPPSRQTSYYSNGVSNFRFS